MDLWDRDAIDLIGPAFIEIKADGTGTFRFIAVEGHLDCRYDKLDDEQIIEFSWSGHDEGDQVSGRGWIRLEPDGSLQGHIFFHMGDDSGFRAVSRSRQTQTLQKNSPTAIVET